MPTIGWRARFRPPKADGAWSALHAACRFSPGFRGTTIAYFAAMPDTKNNLFLFEAIELRAELEARLKTLEAPIT